MTFFNTNRTLIGGAVLVLVVVAAGFYYTRSPDTQKRPSYNLPPYPGNFGMTMRRLADKAGGTKSVRGLGYTGQSRQTGPGGVRTIKDSVRDDKLILYATLKTDGDTKTPAVYLIDRTGEVVHRWQSVFRSLFQSGRGIRYVRSARVTEDGALYVLFQNRGIARITPNGTVDWRRSFNALNNFTLHEGRIYALAQRRVILNDLSRTTRLYDNVINVYRMSDGRRLDSFSLHKGFRSGFYQHVPDQALMLRMAKDGTELYHTNSIQYLDQKRARHIKAARPGDFLLSLRYPSMVVIYRPSDRRVVWTQRGPYWLQHSAHLGPDGRMNVFDNLHRKKQSRILTLKPDQATTVFNWTDDEFYTGCCGRVEATADGYFITETEKARLIELNADGQILWEYVSPWQAEADDLSLASPLFQGQLLGSGMIDETALRRWREG